MGIRVRDLKVRVWGGLGFRDLGFSLRVFREFPKFRGTIPTMENHMEKEMENEKEAGIME